MGTIKRLNKWANNHSYAFIDILRIILGVFLFSKGAQFMQDNQALNDLFAPLENLIGGMLAIHLVIPAHLVGGIMIIFGLMTRLAVIVQIPLLIGAVLINFTGEMNTTNLILATITLFVCIFFFIYGSGKRSADYFFKMQQ
tara:strand:- start:2137 stop:2559 length:423 start_codon:yes stop_codon:yes gene_type:complete